MYPSVEKPELVVELKEEQLSYIKCKDYQSRRDVAVSIVDTLTRLYHDNKFIDREARKYLRAIKIWEKIIIDIDFEIDSKK